MAIDVDAQMVSDFRGYYPEFTDPDVWSESLVTRSLESGVQETGGSRWGKYATDPASFRARGLFAYAAHRLVVNKQAAKAVEQGMAPSSVSRVQSKSVADESVGYAVAQKTAENEASTGDLDTTVYGQEFIRLRRRAATGGMTAVSARHL